MISTTLGLALPLAVIVMCSEPQATTTLNAQHRSLFLSFLLVDTLIHSLTHSLAFIHDHTHTTLTPTHPIIRTNHQYHRHHHYHNPVAAM